MGIKTGAAAAVAFFAATSSGAVTNLVVNGDFEQSSCAVSCVGTNTVFTGATGWKGSGFGGVFVPDIPGAANLGRSTGWKNSFWGPGRGVANGFQNSPTGGNFIAGDADTKIAFRLSQLVPLTAGQRYRLQFDWAAGQAYTFNGATTERLEVRVYDGQSFLRGLGSGAKNPQTLALNYFTNTVQTPSHGFNGWFHEDVTFTANGNNVLEFFSQGTPSGLPPFTMLDGVSITAAVPEPASWAMLIAGFGIVGGVLRRRRSQPVAA